MNYVRPLALTLTASLILGCGEGAAEPNQAVEVAWISKGRCNSFFDISRFGARLASQDLGDHELKLEMLEPDDCPDSQQHVPEVPAECASAARQMGSVEQAIASGVDAIAISALNPLCLTPLLDRAVQRGTKVLTFDSDAPDSLRHVYYGMDGRAAGRLSVKGLAALIGETGKIAVQTAMTQATNGTYQLSSSFSYVERMAGIEEELAEHPGLEWVATVPCIGNEVTDPACALEIEALLALHPDLVGLVLARGKVLREVGLAVAAPGFNAAMAEDRLHTVAFDAPDDAIANIEAGFADLVIAQKQFGWGYDVVRLAHDMVSDGRESPTFYDSGWYAVCDSNLAEYAQMWRDQDFRAELPPCAWLP
jgi:ribose transport system substrate-binding protein